MIDVAITIDIEFSVAGALTYPDRFRPVGQDNVTCPIDGREHGLGLILALLAEYDLTATFFVEVLQTIYFGDDPMGEILARIRSAGHEVQPHIHPCWLHFRDPDWRRGSALAAFPLNDSLVGRDLAENTRILTEVLAIWQRLGLEPPHMVRTGGLRVDRALYRLLAAMGIARASNVGLGIYKPEETELHLFGGAHRFDGVMEIPVRSYLSSLPRLRREPRSVTLAGSSWSEILWLLDQDLKNDISPLVILTHPFELVVRDRHHRILGPNRLVQGRLRRLCQFLARRRDEFTAIRLGDPNWTEKPNDGGPIQTMPWPWQMMRTVENLLFRKPL